MPSIIVVADTPEGEAVLLRERVTVPVMESAHYSAQLVERLAWAVEDADAAERERAPA